MQRWVLPVVVFGVLKGWQRYAGVEDLRFLLVPTEAILRVIRNSDGVWVEGQGYLHVQEHFLIDATCAGFTFLLISFLVLYLVLPRHRQDYRGLLACLLLAWPLTVVVNVARIQSILTVGTLVPGSLHSAVAHEAVGVVVYLFGLCAAYFFARHLLLVRSKRL